MNKHLPDVVKYSDVIIYMHGTGLPHTDTAVFTSGFSQKHHNTLLKGCSPASSAQLQVFTPGVSILAHIDLKRPSVSL